MKRLLWILKYARHMKQKTGFPMKFCIRSAKASLADLDGDLSECPIYSADEECYAMADACR